MFYKLQRGRILQSVVVSFLYFLVWNNSEYKGVYVTLHWYGLIALHNDKNIADQERRNLTMSIHSKSSKQDLTFIFGHVLYKKFTKEIYQNEDCDVTMMAKIIVKSTVNKISSQEND